MKARNLFVLAAAAALVLTGCTAQAPTEEVEVVEEGTADGEVTIYLVRHGKTMLNTTDRVQGWSDAVLTPQGEEVVTAAGCGLADVSFSAAYSSDLGRAMQTANIILDENKNSEDVVLVSDDRLREFNFGTWEGEHNELFWRAIAEDQGITLEEFLTSVDPEDFANSAARLDAANPESANNWPAEDYDTISKRLTESINEIAETEAENGGGNVLVVSHGLALGALLKGIVPDFTMPEGGLKNASVSVVTYKDGTFTVDSVNDMSYVEACTVTESPEPSASAEPEDSESPEPEDSASPEPSASPSE